MNRRPIAFSRSTHACERQSGYSVDRFTRSPAQTIRYVAACIFHPPYDPVLTARRFSYVCAFLSAHAQAPSRRDRRRAYAAAAVVVADAAGGPGGGGGAVPDAGDVVCVCG